MRSFLRPLGWCNGWEEQVEGQRGRENYLCFRCYCISDEWGPQPPTSKSRMQRLRWHETVANSSTSSPTGGISHHWSTLRYLHHQPRHWVFYSSRSSWIVQRKKRAAALGLPRLSWHCFEDKGAHSVRSWTLRIWQVILLQNKLVTSSFNRCERSNSMR